MKNVSVTTFIHILFIIALIVLGATFYYLLYAGKDQRKLQQINRYKMISDTFLTREKLDENGTVLKKLYKHYGLEPVDPDKVKDEIESEGKTIFSGRSIYGNVRVFKTPKHNYIYVDRYDYMLMLLDKHPQDYIYELLLTIATILVLLLLFMYVMVLRKLYPLKRLHRRIEQFAAGDLNVKIDEMGEDEIGKIGRSFDKAIRHIKQLMSSKNLFMRNIMHELKTPITKGRIIVETIEDPMAKQVLTNAFERMNELISDLAEVERITMYNFQPELRDTTLKEVVDRTERILMTDKSKYEIQLSDRPLHTDVKLLALVLKNLMDNGIKYSPDHHVRLMTVGKRIEVRSVGEPLKEDLSYYTEPFSQEEKRSHGFGLGLYIVANILEKLGYGFRYRYDKQTEENVFEVIMD
ncbi:ArsS family sensor histidine kinase [Nitratifractor salsuginis]|uniref:histidine kinase n=1 Tax=Nitratifractor salsuginis (strain DSM 16511 / JCM 12458 / E9I37-1) TaxID=749222 RepID=E6WZE5_NITSE|nr:ArsS family sensor histidine kinase [Nitratifractor salsuginis]ADV45525.1 integral membrane sensor signal transduction histidine kinase [Nitratifractor salsuginis DSM 16511]